MPVPENYSFERYLASKKSVDDRALNAHVLNTFSRSLPQMGDGAPLRWLEAGAGIGTMAERLLEAGLLRRGQYTAIDLLDENVQAAHQRLAEWGARRGLNCSADGDGLHLSGDDLDVRLSFVTGNLLEWLANGQERHRWDVLVAHAFLDLMNMPAVLPAFLELLAEGGLFYFTINFDGLTLLEPPIDPGLDERILRLYHRSMDERIEQGQPSGDSRTGRHLFAQLSRCGAEILDAGASDWVVYPRRGAYPADEAYFLHFIIHTIDRALCGSPELDHDQFRAWVARRHRQVEQAELVYIAHQLDFTGRRSGGG